MVDDFHLWVLRFRLWRSLSSMEWDRDVVSHSWKCLEKSVWWLKSHDGIRVRALSWWLIIINYIIGHAWNSVTILQVELGSHMSKIPNPRWLFVWSWSIVQGPYYGFGLVEWEWSTQWYAILMVYNPESMTNPYWWPRTTNTGHNSESVGNDKQIWELLL